MLQPGPHPFQPAIVAARPFRGKGQTRRPGVIRKWRRHLADAGLKPAAIVLKGEVEDFTLLALGITEANSATGDSKRDVQHKPALSKFRPSREYEAPLGKIALNDPLHWRECLCAQFRGSEAEALGRSLFLGELV